MADSHPRCRQEGWTPSCITSCSAPSASVQSQGKGRVWRPPCRGSKVGHQGSSVSCLLGCGGPGSAWVSGRGLQELGEFGVCAWSRAFLTQPSLQA